MVCTKSRNLIGNIITIFGMFFVITRETNKRMRNIFQQAIQGCKHNTHQTRVVPSTCAYKLKKPYDVTRPHDITLPF